MLYDIPFSSYRTNVRSPIIEKRNQTFSLNLPFRAPPLPIAQQPPRLILPTTSSIISPQSQIAPLPLLIVCYILNHSVPLLEANSYILHPNHPRTTQICRFFIAFPSTTTSTINNHTKMRHKQILPSSPARYFISLSFQHKWTPNDDYVIIAAINFSPCLAHAAQIKY